ncbi:prepilin-type N-terminal cleavage/methylation domain-containing protein [Levilactobacillus zymae]|uniref:prepilin-type N-terminal cleavage/methylation domain-containing protein n=1 Tax=Levilactobacillus zymae TaxID=267363 RepID=UPI0028BAB734|nr:prepilin-type N-terminal cleavage/methylation domain-containing protein [Levilactobacillus zymae]MDT6980925.1 prepilin-type N-terminal cleavage/methylation domain-containing protein [Levilactobacillus zymae]
MQNVRHGFTLVEMTIVLFIISLLILIILPNLTGQRGRAQNIHRDAMATLVEGQANAYLDEHNDDRHPETQVVSYEVLQAEGYLTPQQVKRAQAERLELGSHGHVYRKKLPK